MTIQWNPIHFDRSRVILAASKRRMGKPLRRPSFPRITTGDTMSRPSYAYSVQARSIQMTTQWYPIHFDRSRVILTVRSDAGSKSIKELVLTCSCFLKMTAAWPKNSTRSICLRRYRLNPVRWLICVEPHDDFTADEILHLRRMTISRSAPSRISSITERTLRPNTSSAPQARIEATAGTDPGPRRISPIGFSLNLRAGRHVRQARQPLQGPACGRALAGARLRTSPCRRPPAG